MLERGVVVSYETIRRWCDKFGQANANRLRRRRARPGDKWFLDEVFVRINGVQHYLWHAVDQDGTVLDVLVQSRRNTKAAKQFFRNLLKGCCRPVSTGRCWLISSPYDARLPVAPSPPEKAPATRPLYHHASEHTVSPNIHVNVTIPQDGTPTVRLISRRLRASPVFAR